MKRYLLILATALTIFSCQDPYEDTVFTPFDVKPAATYFSSRDTIFSEWIELLNYTDLYNAANQSSKTYTFAVPTNDAVKSFLADYGVASVTDLDLIYAKTLVKFHMLNRAVQPKELTNGGRISTPTLSNDYWDISFDEDYEGLGATILINGEAAILEEGNTVTNGVVYTIDRVLSPLVETIYDRLKEDVNYSLFTEAVELTGWDKTLSVVIDSVYNPGVGTVGIYKNYTALVVPNEVFKAAGITTIPQLVSFLEVEGANYTDASNGLNEYVAYHLMSSTSYVEELYTFPEGVTATIFSNLADRVFATSVDEENNYWINYDLASLSGIQFIAEKTNMEAKNGILHEIDGVMPVSEPEALPVSWDLTNSDDIASLVNTFSSANNYGEIYQTLQVKSYVAVRYNKYYVSSASWVAKSRSNIKLPSVSYYLAGDPKEYGVDDNYSYPYRSPDGQSASTTSGANNHDFLCLNLGANGSVTLKTPVLVAGEYKVDIYYGYNSDLEDLAAGGSLSKFTFEGTSPIYPLLYKGATYAYSSGGNKINNMTIASSIRFETTGAKEMQIVLLDPRATTSSSYYLLLDKIVFTPL
ncbi:MAG: fasciclin domain-containing protein [Bacteroidales bacterium]